MSCDSCSSAAALLLLSGDRTRRVKNAARGAAIRGEKEKCATSGGEIWRWLAKSHQIIVSFVSRKNMACCLRWDMRIFLVFFGAGVCSGSSTCRSSFLPPSPSGEFRLSACAACYSYIPASEDLFLQPGLWSLDFTQSDGIFRLSNAAENRTVRPAKRKLLANVNAYWKCVRCSQIPGEGTSPITRS